MNTGNSGRFEQAQNDINLADVIFLSIQKSGRTWVRYFLQEYFGRVAGTPIAMAPRIMAETEVSPAISFHADFFEVFEHEIAPVQMLFPGELSTKPLVLLVRDPRDVVVSAYHYTRARRPLDVERNLPSDDIDDYVRSEIYGVERLAEYQLLATAFYHQHRAPKMFLTYERLRADPAGEFARLAAFLSLTPIDRAAFDAALAASALDAMQDYEIAVSREGRAREIKRLGVDNWSGDVNDLKVRRGAVGGYRDECPALDQFDAFPVTRAALAEQIDPLRCSDTHWTVGSAGHDADARALLVARQRQFAARIDELQAKNDQLRATIRGRDAIIAKLKQRLEAAQPE